MKKTLGHIFILHLEDNEDDSNLVKFSLGSSSRSYVIENVKTREDFQGKDYTKFDLILLDYNLGDYDGLTALKWIRKTDAMVPIIFVSGSLEEALVVELLRAGATDFVHKSYLQRLPLVILRALKEHENTLKNFKFQQEIVKSNLILDTIFDNLRDGIYLKDRSLKYLKINKANCTFLGKSERDIIGKTDRDVVNEEFIEGAIADDEKVISTGLPSKYEIQKIDKDGSILILEIIKYPIFEEDQVNGILGTIRDVTKQKNVVSELKKIQTILNQAENISNTGSFEYDADSDLVTCSVHMLKLLNINIEANTMSFRRLIRSIYSSGNEKFQDQFYKAVEKNNELVASLKVGTVEKPRSLELWLKPDTSGQKNKFYGTIKIEA